MMPWTRFHRSRHAGRVALLLHALSHRSGPAHHHGPCHERHHGHRRHLHHQRCHSATAVSNEVHYPPQPCRRECVSPNLGHAPTAGEDAMAERAVEHVAWWRAPTLPHRRRRRCRCRYYRCRYYRWACRGCPDQAAIHRVPRRDHGGEPSGWVLDHDRHVLTVDRRRGWMRGHGWHWWLRLWT